MKIVLASSEAVPFSKTGGLADVAAALPKALAADGHEVYLVAPHYPRAAKGNLPPIERTGKSIEVRIGRKSQQASLLQSQLPDSDVTVWLIDHAGYFDRSQLYRDNGADFPDNCERFVFFSRAVMETVRRMRLAPDVIHTNDWQTGLVPALLDVEYRRLPGFEGTGSVFTVHNMAFQGQFWHWDMLLTGLDWKYFNWKQMEFFDHLNLLKTGIVFADMVTTVSPTYAREIQSKEFGCGLHGVLSSRGDDLVGILNGIDVEIWNPQTDPTLPKNYSVVNWKEGKAACKAQLQGKMGLPVKSDVPLFGMISRITDQKGFDLISECADDVLLHDVQFCILGSGEEQYERRILELSRKYPSKVACRIGFDDGLAHEIEAGADVYLMPSRYEPCGLNQMYSLRYGTVPLVRAVGGLADSVVDASAAHLADGSATGFVFGIYHSRELARQIERAIGMYRDRETWRRLVEAGMRQDCSWRRSAQEYVRVYQRAQRKHLASAAATLSAAEPR